MLRVLHCIYDDPDNPWVGGGGAMRVREIYRRLTDEVEATVLTGNHPGARDGDRDGVNYVHLGVRRPYAAGRLTYGIAATRRLAREPYDVGIFDYSVYTPIRLPRDRPVGLVIHMLHGPSARGRWGALGGTALAGAERAAIRSARWISTTSRWMVAQLEPHTAPGTTIVPVGSGIPPEFADVVRGDGEHLLFYGRLDIYHKGIDTLLDAFARVQARHPTVRLVIAGRGKDAARVEELAAQPRFGGRIDVRPAVERREVLELMAGALALVMPSRLEGLPMVPAEAMAAGIPVIASDVGALAEVVNAPEAGLLVPAENPAALAEAIGRLLDDTVLRQRMSLAARRSAERFSWDRVARAHLGFLRDIADHYE